MKMKILEGIARFLGNNNKEIKTEGQLPSERFFGRLNGFTWDVLKARDPSYDEEKVKAQLFVIRALQARDFMSEEELKVMDILVDLVKSRADAPANKAQAERMMGGLEGISIILYNRPASDLLKDEDI